MKLPFAAISGMETAKEALLLLAVDPSLCGVTVAAGPGTAKSLLARSAGQLRPDAPFIEVPLSATADRLLGGLDLEHTLRAGVRRHSAGLLAQADGGLLYIDEINLLERRLGRSVVGALSEGAVRVERDGISAWVPAAFSLVGTYDPAEGPLASALVGAVGLHVHQADGGSPEERMEILSAVTECELDQAAFVSRFEPEMKRLREQVASARALLSRVVLNDNGRRHLIQTALALGVEGNRADLFAFRATRARAALHGRAEVAAEDLETAIRLVLAPRATQMPAAATDEAPAEQEPGQTKSTPSERGKATQPPEEFVLAAVDSEIAREWLALADSGAGSGPSHTTSRRAVGPVEHSSPTRGRFVRAVASGSGRVAVEATLRAAAPLQKVRRNGANGRAIHVAPSDLRFKQFQQKTGLLIVFAVDGSGSMARNRMSQAKGAVLRLLAESYPHRDKVALVAFRGDGAEVLLPPSRSLTHARQALHEMPTGGGTPLAAGLAAALELVEHTRRSEPRPTLLVMLTDGRANVTRSGDASTLWREIEQAGAAIRSAGIGSVVIDTRQIGSREGDAARVAQLLGGRYAHLPRPTPSAVADAVRTEASQTRGAAA